MRLLLALLVSLPAAAAAQNAGSGNSVAFTLGAGAQSNPDYFGSETSSVTPKFSFNLDALNIGPVSGGGGGAASGLRPKVSFRLIGERTADDNPELAGLDDLDLSVELGGGLAYRLPNAEAFAVLRYGVVGHESWVAEVGGDVFYRPTDQLTLSAGPRILWGSDDYAQTYFGVSADESLASGFDTFEAGGGVVSKGLRAQAQYDINDTWGVTGTIRYDVLSEDAATSPITQKEDQISGSVVLTRKFYLNF